MTKCIETWVSRIVDPIHTREFEYVMGIIRDRIHICPSIPSFKIEKSMQTKSRTFIQFFLCGASYFFFPDAPCCSMDMIFDTESFPVKRAVFFVLKRRIPDMVAKRV